MATFSINKILVPVDFSKTSEKALQQAIIMAKMNKAAIVLLVSIEGSLGNTGTSYFGLSVKDPENFEKQIMGWARDHMEALKANIKKHGVSKVSYIIKKGAAYRRIVSVAETIKADIIIMGTHGISGMREFIAGSNTYKVVSEAKCPVLSIQKQTQKTGFKNILVPIRRKAHSREKVDYAIHMAKIYGATLHIVGISFDKSATALKSLQLEAEQVKKIAGQSGVKTTEQVIAGNFSSKKILEYASRKKADLVVIMADHDKEGLSEYFTGTVGQQIVNHSTIPVLSIHPDVHPKLMVGTGDWSFWG